MIADSGFMTISVSYDTATSKPTINNAVRLESIEAVGDRCKIRMTFKNEPTIGDVLSDNFRDEILQKLLDFEDVKGLLSVPDYTFICRELSLSRLSVFGSDRDNGRTVVTLRWSNVVGNVYSALRICPEFLIAPKTPNARLAFDVLDCVLQPIFELTASQEINVDDPKHAAAASSLINDFLAKRDELEKYAKMLKIYLEHEARAQSTSGSEAHISQMLSSKGQRYLC